jgi:hypothetical protein
MLRALCIFFVHFYDAAGGHLADCSGSAANMHVQMAYKESNKRAVPERRKLTQQIQNVTDF